MSTASRTIKPFYKSTTLQAAVTALVMAAWPVGVEWVETREPPSFEEAWPVLLAAGALGKIGYNRFRIDDEHPEKPVGTPNWLPGRDVPSKLDLVMDMIKASDQHILSTFQGGDPTSSVEQSDTDTTGEIVRAAVNNQQSNFKVYRDAYTIQFIKESFLKNSTQQSYNGDDSTPTDESHTYDILSWEPVDSNHLRVILVDGERVKFVYAPDVRIFDSMGKIVHEPITPFIQIEVTEDKGPKIKMSGIGEVFLYESIIPNGNLTWNEMTKGGERLPTKTEETSDYRYTPSQQVQNMILVAEEFEKIRLLWGKPIIITSGLRPFAVNAAIGGASRSQHRTGLALDCVTEDIYGFEDFCLKHWPGRIGRAATGGRGFVHLDLKDCCSSNKPYRGSDRVFSY